MLTFSDVFAEFIIPNQSDNAILEKFLTQTSPFVTLKSARRRGSVQDIKLQELFHVTVVYYCDIKKILDINLVF